MIRVLWLIAFLAQGAFAAEPSPLPLGGGAEEFLNNPKLKAPADAPGKLGRCWDVAHGQWVKPNDAGYEQCVKASKSYVAPLLPGTGRSPVEPVSPRGLAR